MTTLWLMTYFSDGIYFDRLALIFEADKPVAVDSVELTYASAFPGGQSGVMLMFDRFPGL